MLVHELVPEGLGQLHLVLDLHRLLIKNCNGVHKQSFVVVVMCNEHRIICPGSLGLSVTSARVQA